MAAIELEGLTKEFGPVTALQDVDLTVEEGEIFGFLGPNGAGKSTTIDILLDFVRPTSGTAHVCGFDAQSEQLSIRDRVGFLPDAYALYERLTGRHHLAFTIASKDADDDPITLLERVGITDAVDRKVGGYSKGMRQRLVLAMALVGEPDLLILDEPSAGLDPNGAREMRKIIQQENERGATIFFSSHKMGQVEAVCDRVGILNRGRLVAVDSIDGLRQAVDAETTLLVSVGEPDAETLAAAESIDVVSEATLLDNSTVRLTLTEKKVLAALNELETAGVTVHEFEVEQSSLEDLFAAYTVDQADTPKQTPPGGEAQ